MTTRAWGRVVRRMASVAGVAGAAWGVGAVWNAGETRPAPRAPPQWIPIALFSRSKPSFVDSVLHVRVKDAPSRGKDRPLTRYSVADAVARVHPAVVCITSVTEGLFGASTVQGSGVLLNGEGLCVTNAHVLSSPRRADAETPQRVRVSLADGREYWGVVERVNVSEDLALVQLEGVETALPHAELGKASALRVGEFVAAIGSPLVPTNTLSLGVVSRQCKGHDIGLPMSGTLVQSDVAVNAGNSGGPLVNLDGQVVGITTMRSTDHGLTLSLAIEDALDHLAVMHQAATREGHEGAGEAAVGAGGVAGRRKFQLGMGMLTLDRARLDELRVRDESIPRKLEHAVWIRVKEGTPAYRAGLRTGDIILEMDKVPIETKEQVVHLLDEDCGEGAEEAPVHSITVLRQGERFTLSIRPQPIATPPSPAK